mmetsp:Transcript_124347/g.348258  ORF Transcript_124347/g.348258 Transcript_124347/m.348258 type:complete len:440 (+) Transcript_124347:267-1586(+)
MLQALQTVHGLYQWQLRRPSESAVDLVHHLVGRGLHLGHAGESLLGAEQRGHLCQDDLPHSVVRALLLELRHEAEVGERGDELVVCVVPAGQIKQLDQGLQTMKQLPLSAHDVVRQNVCGGIIGAIHHEPLDQLVRLLHGVPLEKLLAVRILVHLLGLAAGSGGGSRYLRRLRGLLPLLLVLQLLLVRGAQLGARTVAVLRRRPDGLAAGSHVEELQVDLEGVLRRTPVELVREEPVLHAEHGHVRLQGRLLQAIVVEIELVLGDVVEVLEGLVVLLQRLAVVLLPVVAPAHGGLVPHALHVVQVGGLGRVGLLGEEQRLLHAALRVVEPQQCPDALRVQVPVREVQRPYLLVPLGRLLEVAGVPVDPRLAKVELHERRRVVDGAVDVAERLLRLAEEVEVVCGDHPREEEARGGLVVVHRGLDALLTDARAEPRDLLF